MARLLNGPFLQMRHKGFGDLLADPEKANPLPDQSGQTKIGKNESYSFFCRHNQYIGEFNGSMHNACFMRIIERRCDLTE